MKTGRHPKWATNGPHGVEIPRFLTTKLTSETLQVLWGTNVLVDKKHRDFLTSRTSNPPLFNAKTMYKVANNLLQHIYSNSHWHKTMLFFATHIGSSRPGFGSAWKSALDRHDGSADRYPKVPNAKWSSFSKVFDGNSGIYLRHFWTHPYVLFGSILMFWWLNHRLLLFTEDITENHTSGQPLSLIIFALHPPINSHTSPFFLVKHLSH